MLRDVLRPVVREEDVKGTTKLAQLQHVDFADVVEGAHLVVAEWGALVVPMAIVVLLVDARETANANAADSDHARKAKVEDIGCHPATIRELAQVSASLMIATDEDGEDGRLSLSREVFVESLHVAVLGWAGHAGEVGCIAHSLQCMTHQHMTW